MADLATSAGGQNVVAGTMADMATSALCAGGQTKADLATSALCAGGQNVVAGTMADLATSARGQKKEAAQPPAAESIRALTASDLYQGMPPARMACPLDMQFVLQSFPLAMQLKAAFPRELPAIEHAFAEGEINTLECQDFKSMSRRDPLTNDLLESITRRTYYSLPDQRQMLLGILRCDLMAFKSDKAGLCLHWLSLFPSHRRLTLPEVFHYEIMFPDFIPPSNPGGIGHVNFNQIPSMAESLNDPFCCVNHLDSL